MFTGDQGEDFSRFKREMEKALRQNRVTRSDQAAKLRDSLTGHAKQLVPDTMENIDDAWEVLHAAFGDASRVMKAKKDKLAAMGSYPAAGRGSAPIKKQVEWLMSLELVLKDIVDLGSTSADMDREAFSGWTLSKILSMFPLLIQADLTTCKGDWKERLVGIIVELRKL